MASLLTAEGYVIPHDEAYASANRHHHPTAVTREAQPPTRGPRSAHASPIRERAIEPGYGVVRAQHGRLLECARSMSIVVQKLDAEFSGAVPRAQVKVGGKGHKVWGPF